MFRVRSEQEEEHSEQISWLRSAALQGDAQLLEAMLSQEIYRRLLNCRSGWGVAGTPLHAAASRGHAGCVRVLLAHGALVDSLDVKAQTPLFTAARGKYLRCLLQLLCAGADPNGSSFNLCSPVLTAAREGDADVLRILLQYGAEVNELSKVLVLSSVASVCSGPLYLAAVYGHRDCFRLLLLYGADPDYNCVDALLMRLRQRRTVLEMCLRHGCGADYVQLLIDFGANVYLPTLIIEKTTKQNEALELLLRERGTPKSLTSQCRLALRRHLRKINKIHLLDQLDLPQSLLLYLQHLPPPVLPVL
ncbi:unnamed protein product [Knipowitschia caucasica]